MTEDRSTFLAPLAMRQGFKESITLGVDQLVIAVEGKRLEVEGKRLLRTQDSKLGSKVVALTSLAPWPVLVPV